MVGEIAEVDGLDRALVTDLVVPQLEAAGIDVVFESLIEAGGADVGSATEAAALNAEAMRGEGVDAVVVVGETLVIASAFIGVDYFPTMLLGDMGSALGLAADADLSVFDDVYTFGNYPNTYRYDEQSFQDECVPVWDAAHPDDPVIDPDEVADGEPDHTVGLGVACRSLTIFVKAAEAAGAELNNETFLDGVESSATLYDLRADPLEQRDLYTQNLPQAERMGVVLNWWLKETGQWVRFDEALAASKAKEDELRALGYLR